MYIYYNIEKDNFVTKEFLSPKGKVISGQIGDYKFFEAYKTFSDTFRNKQSQIAVLQEKVKTDDEALKAAYREEIDKLMAQEAPSIPQNRKMTTVKMRVVGYNQDGSTIVEPYDKLQKNILIKRGYFKENKKIQCRQESNISCLLGS